MGLQHDAARYSITTCTLIVLYLKKILVRLLEGQTVHKTTIEIEIYPGRQRNKQKTKARKREGTTEIKKISLRNEDETIHEKCLTKKCAQNYYATQL